MSEYITIRIKDSTLQCASDELRNEGVLLFDNATGEEDRIRGRWLETIADEIDAAVDEALAKVQRKPHVMVEQHYYLDYITEYGPQYMEDLALIFDVSVTTAARKLEGLEGQGKLRKVRRDDKGTLYDLTQERSTSASEQGDQ